MSKEKGNMAWIADYSILIIDAFIRDFKYVGQVSGSLQTLSILLSLSNIVLFLRCEPVSVLRTLTYF